MVAEIKSEDDFNRATNKRPVVVVDFYAQWCGPCREIAPILADWERQMSDLDEEDIAFFKLDIEEVPSVARDLEITSMPTFMIYRNGKLMKTVVGAKVSSLRRAIDKAMRTWEAELEEEEESM